MRKTFVIPLLALVAVAFVSTGTAGADMKKEGKTYIRLSAFPKVKTAGEGKATFDLSKDGSSIHYKLDVEKISDVTMAHIHAVGEDGTPGAILVWLYPVGGNAPSLKAGKVSGTLAEGEITADKIGGPMKGKSVKELFEAIGHGKAGVAVHTKANPRGELWGTHGKYGREKGEHRKTKPKTMEKSTTDEKTM
ncbi:MAG: CHRD domain-containing protein [Candidatus Deferrimicrobiaceae bacterium]